MNEEQFTPQEQAVIRRLQSAPQPRLNPVAFDAIRQQMLDAMDLLPPASAPAPRLPRPVPSAPLIALTLAALLVIGVVVVFIRPQLPSITNLEPLTPTAIPTTSIPPTQTPIPTTLPTDLPTAEPNQVLIPVQPDATITTMATATPMVESTSSSTATEAAILIVEGPVEKLEDNVLTIYGIKVVINPEDPLLPGVQVGDIVRIEGGKIVEIPATQASPATVEASVDPGTGEVWQDDGTCQNPPPDWAPANGWRRRCQGQTNPPAPQDNPGQANKPDDKPDKGKGKD